MHPERANRSAFVEWRGYSCHETLELMLQVDGSFVIEHESEPHWWDGESIQSVEPHGTVANVIEHLRAVIHRFEADMPSSTKAGLLAALL